MEGGSPELPILLKFLCYLAKHVVVGIAIYVGVHQYYNLSAGVVRGIDKNEVKVSARG
jgi:hypothetical protein